MAILMAATVLRHKNRSYKLENKPNFDIFKERKKREEKLDPEKLARYHQALEEIKIDPGLSKPTLYNLEKDAIIGAFLGKDLREHPDYQSKKVIKMREEKLTPEELEKYHQALEKIKKDPSITEPTIYNLEKDAIIGAFLGQDIRVNPDYYSHRVVKMREEMLTPEELEKYQQALEEFDNDPGYPEGMVDGESMLRYRLREKDAIIGLFLGQDIRQFPDYKSKRFPATDEKTNDNRTR